MTDAEKRLFLKGMGVGMSIRRLTGSAPGGSGEILPVGSVRFAAVTGMVVEPETPAPVTSVTGL